MRDARKQRDGVVLGLIQCIVIVLDALSCAALDEMMFILLMFLFINI